MSPSSSPPCPPPSAHRTTLTHLPTETLLQVFANLGPKELARVARLARSIRAPAVSDSLWRPIVNEALAGSPPAHSPKLSAFEGAVPWHPAFSYHPDLSKWPLSSSELDGKTQSVDQVQSYDLLKTFPGARSFYDVYIHFVRPFLPLLGWWASDVPSYGMVMRVIFDPACAPRPIHSPSSEDGMGAGMSAGAGAGASPSAGPSSYSGGLPSAAFVCQKVHLINRLRGLDADMDEWREATSFPMPEATQPFGQGTELRRAGMRISVDLCEAGVRTEEWWEVRWDRVLSEVRAGRKPERAMRRLWHSPGEIQTQNRGNEGTWLGGLAPRTAIPGGWDETDGEFGVAQYDDDGFGQGQDAFGSMNTDRPYLIQPIRHLINGEEHLVHPVSGVVTSRPSRQMDDGSVSVSLAPYQPYLDAESHHSVFALPAASLLPAVLFPTPALLPAIRTVEDSRVRALNTHAQERWTNQGTRAEFDSLLMSPAPPYRPWPHLAPPLSHGPRFFPIRAPARAPLRAPPKRIERAPPSASGPSSLSSSSGSLMQQQQQEEMRKTVRYEHLPPEPRLDPANENFDWESIEGLYAATYGPHGLELLYIRTRILDEHDFAPHSSWTFPRLAQPLASGSTSNSVSAAHAPTMTAGSMGSGPEVGSSAGTAASASASTSSATDPATPSASRPRPRPPWPPEPLLSDSGMFDGTRISRTHVQPGKRVLEAVKVLGDPNVPRGQITFRAFLDDPGRLVTGWRPPPSENCRNHTPWPYRSPARASAGAGAGVGANGEAETKANAAAERPPGVVVPGTGRVAGEGFVGAGWASCLVHIASPDEIRVWWQPMYKVAVCRRLVAA